MNFSCRRIDPARSLDDVDPKNPVTTRNLVNDFDTLPDLTKDGVSAIEMRLR
jgi:hypothetical protein